MAEHSGNAIGFEGGREMNHILFDQFESTRTRYLGFVADGIRYDFTITYSQYFFGKAIVICLQSNKSALLDMHDINILDVMMHSLNLTHQQARHLSELLEAPLSDRLLLNKYDEV